MGWYGVFGTYRVRSTTLHASCGVFRVANTCTAPSVGQEVGLEVSSFAGQDLSIKQVTINSGDGDALCPSLDEPSGLVQYVRGDLSVDVEERDERPCRRVVSVTRAAQD